MTIDTGDAVTLEYTGRLDDDTVFDTSRQTVADETGLAEAQPDREYAPLTETLTERLATAVAARRSEGSDRFEWVDAGDDRDADDGVDATPTEAQPDREYAPLTVEIGDEQVIEGMEEGLIGLEAGETDTLTIPPEKAYGEPSDDQIQEFETAELREMLGGQTPEAGAYLEAQNGRQGEVVHVDDEVVRVDFNPALAGETLTFDVEIVDVN